jgi:hypothetical protein
MSATAEHTTYFCVNYPTDVIVRFMHDLERDPGIARQPFFLDVLTVEDSMSKWSMDLEDRKLRLLEYVC